MNYYTFFARDFLKTAANSIFRMNTTPFCCGIAFGMGNIYPWLFLTKERPC